MAEYEDGIRIDELPPELTPTLDALFPIMIGGVTKYMTVTQVSNLITAIILDGAPASLDTLNELAAALGDNASFAADVLAQIALKAPLASPPLTGNPTAPTQAPGNDSTRLATTGFVAAAFTALGTAAQIFLSAISGFATKTLPADLDTFGYQQNSDGGGRKLSWANIKSALADVFLGVGGNGSVTTTTLNPSVLVTGILSTTKYFRAPFAGLQLVTNAQNIIFQFGVAGALVTTGYAGSGSRLAAAAVGTLNSTIGCLFYTASNTEISSGVIEAELVDVATNLWHVKISGGCGQTATFLSEAYIALAGPPDRFALTATSGNIVAGGKINTRQWK